jgi:hypothetical protein
MEVLKRHMLATLDTGRRTCEKVSFSLDLPTQVDLVPCPNYSKPHNSTLMYQPLNGKTVYVPGFTTRLCWDRNSGPLRKRFRDLGATVVDKPSKSVDFSVGSLLLDLDDIYLKLVDKHVFKVKKQRMELLSAIHPNIDSIPPLPCMAYPNDEMHTRCPGARFCRSFYVPPSHKLASQLEQNFITSAGYVRPLQEFEASAEVTGRCKISRLSWEIDQAVEDNRWGRPGIPLERLKDMAAYYEATKHVGKQLTHRGMVFPIDAALVRPAPMSALLILEDVRRKPGLDVLVHLQVTFHPAATDEFCVRWRVQQLNFGPKLHDPFEDDTPVLWASFMYRDCFDVYRFWMPPDFKPATLENEKEWPSQACTGYGDAKGLDEALKEFATKYAQVTGQAWSTSERASCFRRSSMKMVRVVHSTRGAARRVKTVVLAKRDEAARTIQRLIKRVLS